jgi:hypothetical protein
MVSSVRVLDRNKARTDEHTDDGGWTVVQSPRSSRPPTTSEDVASAIAAARARHRIGAQKVVEIDDESRNDSARDELASDISQAVADFWDR